MQVTVSNLQLPLDVGLPEGDKILRQELAQALGINQRCIIETQYLRRSVDARKKGRVHFVATMLVDLPDGAKMHPRKGIQVKPYTPPKPVSIPDCSGVFAASGEPQPVVVGTGPAGLFAALYLARASLRPLVLERGAAVEERVAAIQRFNEGGPLDVQTNAQFGEGGAGTFSDGKLNTGIKSPHIRSVLEKFVHAGAPDEILWQAHPHIGTDKLPGVISALRHEIQSLGGEVRFCTQLTGLQMVHGAVEGIWFQGPEGNEYHECSRLILACGHSARDTLSLLWDAGFALERKPFAVGVRIEHPQELINRSQYGSDADHPALGAAEYKLAVHLPDGRGVYTFCMCPGGTVVAASSEKGGLCVNGMSPFARDGQNANSALLVGLEPTDFPGDDVFAGVKFQRDLERAAYDLGWAASKNAVSEDGLPYTAPACTVGDFLSGESGHPSTLVAPSYPRGVAWCDLHQCLPPLITEAMESAFPLLNRKLAGFSHPEAVMTAVEARSSSPVRMLRGEDFQAFISSDEETSESPANKNSEHNSDAMAGSTSGSRRCGLGRSGVYPCGEGAGYAGGIMSAAVDGIRVAEALVDEMLSGAATANQQSRVTKRTPIA